MRREDGRPYHCYQFVKHGYENGLDFIMAGQLTFARSLVVATRKCLGRSQRYGEAKDPIKLPASQLASYLVGC